MSQIKEEVTIDKNNFSHAVYGVFYGIRKRILILLYIFCVTCTGSLTIVLLDKTRVPLRIEFLIGLLVAIIGTIGGLLFSVILDLPKVGYEFDEIKNDIASGIIKTPQEFAVRVSDFVCEHFNFFLFNVRYAFIQILDTPCYYSNDAILERLGEKELESITSKSQQTEDVIYFGLHTINKSDFHLYVIPIWFRESWLGFIGIFNSMKLIKIFALYLSSFEDQYIDDQLVHVLNATKGQSKKVP